MPYEFKFPDIGEGITEGDIVKWLVKEGDEVKVDQNIAQIETDKSIAEIPSPKAGTILKIHVKEGETIKVGETLVTIGTKGEKVSKTKEPKIEKKKEVKTKKKIKETKKTGSVVGELEEAKDEDTEIKFHSETRKSEKKALASPAIRKVAHEKNIDIDKIEGSGPKGRILKQDLGKEGVTERVPQHKIVVKKKYDEYGYLERVPLKGVRKTIATHVKKTFDTTAPVTSMFDMDITKLWKIRKKEKNRLLKKGVKLTLLPFIIKSIIISLKEHPILNSSLEEEEILIKKYYNMGIAVDTDVGLMVPVIKIAESKDIIQLAKEIDDLAKKAKSRKIDLADLKGSTFTITNYGSVGGKYGTPIINENNAAIIGIGRAFDKLDVNKAGLIIKRKILPLSLTFDHRILDGAEASYFMETLRIYLEDPDNLLVKT